MALEAAKDVGSFGSSVQTAVFALAIDVEVGAPVRRIGFSVEVAAFELSEALVGAAELAGAREEVTGGGEDDAGNGGDEDAAGGGDEEDAAAGRLLDP
jgi:hypothetical protein